MFHRENQEMRTLLREHGYPEEYSVLLQFEGMGPNELGERLKEQGGLERTHGLKKLVK